jgi:hypothetical protein
MECFNDRSIVFLEIISNVIDLFVERRDDREALLVE